jgi:sirohydrochlorin ferrochelatase
MQMPPLLIVAHGQPSDPERAEAELVVLGAAVALHLPGRQVQTATLAAPGRLAAALTELGPGGRVYPLFMAGGWFTRVHLPGRLALAGAQGWRVLEPMGCDPDVHELAVKIVAEAGDVGSVILAAHGSGQSPVPADIANHVAGLIGARLGRARCEAAFIDQAPRLADLKELGAEAICLPFFAASGGHVNIDIPEALAEAGFGGRILPALGLDARLPALIAAAVLADKPVCAAECAWRRSYTVCR